MVKKVIVRIKGGLGNQLFCYAAARRLAIVNDAELVLDDVSGFARDRQYKRRYMLNHFRIAGRRALASERYEPFERYRRGVTKWLSKTKPFLRRTYVEQEGFAFDDRVLNIRVNGTVYLDGLWQSERYFSDVAQVIREDLEMTAPVDSVNSELAEAIQRSEISVALHMRWFDMPGHSSRHNAPGEYYRRAIAEIERRSVGPQYFVFSDNPDAARAMLGRCAGRMTFVSNNSGDEGASADLWLMRKCTHFITANSSYSWWGAWLGNAGNKVVVTPGFSLVGPGITAWNVPGQIPDEWVRV